MSFHVCINEYIHSFLSMNVVYKIKSLFHTFKCLTKHYQSPIKIVNNNGYCCYYADKLAFAMSRCAAISKSGCYVVVVNVCWCDGNWGATDDDNDDDNDDDDDVNHLTVEWGVKCRFWLTENSLTNLSAPICVFAQLSLYEYILWHTYIYTPIHIYICINA